MKVLLFFVILAYPDKHAVSDLPPAIRFFPVDRVDWRRLSARSPVLRGSRPP